MQLVVEIMTGTIFHVTVGDNATVLNLKIAMQVQENLPGDRLILLLNRDVDHLLLNDDHKPLSEYGVQDGSRLHAFFEPLDEAEKDDDDEAEKDDDDEAEKDNDDEDTGDDKVMDDERTETETEEENDGNDNDDDSNSSSPKSPSEETSVESPQYVDVSD